STTAPVAFTAASTALGSGAGPHLTRCQLPRARSTATIKENASEHEHKGDVGEQREAIALAQAPAAPGITTNVNEEPPNARYGLKEHQRETKQTKGTRRPTRSMPKLTFTKGAQSFSCSIGYPIPSGPHGTSSRL
ncbi:unnamed protein product, partial [Pylaiella littoralis]